MTTYYLLQYYQTADGYRLVSEAELFDCAYAEYLLYEPPEIALSVAYQEQQYQEFAEAIEARDGTRLAEALGLYPEALVLTEYPQRTDYPIRSFPRPVIRMRDERPNKFAKYGQPSFDCSICAQAAAHRQYMPLSETLAWFAFSAEKYLKEHQRTNAHRRVAWEYREALHCVQVGHKAKVWLDKKNFQLEYLRAPMFYGEHYYTPVKDLIEALRDWRQEHGKPPESDEASWKFPKREVDNLWRDALYLQKNPR